MGKLLKELHKEIEEANWIDVEPKDIDKEKKEIISSFQNVQEKAEKFFKALSPQMKERIKLYFKKKEK